MVPLICKGPGFEKNEVIEYPVTNMDLSGTFLQLSETEIPSKWKMTSRSLLPLLRSKGNLYEREVIHSGLGKWRIVAKGNWKLICFPKDCRDERCGERLFDDGLAIGVNGWKETLVLFHLSTDIYELNNVARQNMEVVQELRKEFPGGFCKGELVMEG